MTTHHASAPAGALHIGGRADGTAGLGSYPRI
jgi:hypothetical protein